MNKSKTVVVALGGNAITSGLEEGNIAQQFANTRKSLAGIVDLVEKGYSVAITHGNGPQVGNALIRVEESRNMVPPLPLGVIVANLQGGMGYMIGQTLMNKLHQRKIEKRVVTILTQVLVNKNDSSIANPTKFVGPFYKKEEIKKLQDERGYVIKKDSDRGWRRVVPSPMPIEIVEKVSIAESLSAGNIVIAAGGGGIPVYKEDDGRLEGVDAVIDKDSASAILANDVDADIFLILTATKYVCIDFGKPTEKELREVTLDELKKYQAEGHFPAGSMGPKVSAVIRFLENGGEKAVIASIEDARDAAAGKAGTIITK